MTTRGDSRGCPPWVHLLSLTPGSWCEAVIGGWEKINKGSPRGDASCLIVICIKMNCRGLVDLENRPFGYALPLEIQVKIMFWVECFYTMDKRKKVVQEFKGLPKCSIMGYPKHLGEGLHWNQVVFRLHTPRSTPCHHCHRRIDHRMSVSVRQFFFVGLS